MLAKDLITEEIPPLKLTDKGKKALAWMDEFKVSHLPVIKGVNYLGLISEAEILDMNAPDEGIGKSNPELIRYSISEEQHLFEVIKAISSFNLSVIPVLGIDGNYKGTIPLKHLMKVVSHLSIISELGATVVLEFNALDYSLAEVARIVESENAKILGSFVTSLPSSTKIELTLKINTQNISAIIQAFERFNYTISASFDQGDYSEGLKDRFDSLMNYLNI